MTIVSAFVVSAVVTMTLSIPFAALARARGIVVAPRDDRWHRRPTPLLGGVAIAVGALVAIALFAPDPRTAGVIVACGVAAFALGLFDDLTHLSPNPKLVGQVLVASVLVVGGVAAHITGMPALDFVITVFWTVAIMNAINLMDNMDGLAAGVSAIAGIALALTAPMGDPAAPLVAIAASGAALGFLVHNFHPARVFMGDAGSHLLGFLLAASALLHTSTGATNVGLAVLAPVTILALPIFDTALVTTSRRLRGRSIGVGGRDHMSHRLAALGLSDRAVVVLLYAVAASFAGLALIAEMATLLFFPLVALAAIGLTLFGIFLLEVDVYGRRGVPEQPPGRFAGAFYLYGRFGSEIALDVVLLTTAYYLCYLLRFEGGPQGAWIDPFTQSLPILVGAQLAALVVTGVYRTMWRYVGLHDAIQILRALAFGTSAAALVLLFAFRFEGISRAVFVLDWIAATAFVLGSRAFLLWLRQWFGSRPRADERRVLVVGATDAGAAAIRVLQRPGGAAYRVVGFLDDDPSVQRRRIGGIPIVGTTSELAGTIRRLRVDLVFLAPDPHEHALGEQIRRSCEAIGVEWMTFLMPLEAVAKSR